jgi:hypothetical protein
MSTITRITFRYVASESGRRLTRVLLTATFIIFAHRFQSVVLLLVLGLHYALVRLLAPVNVGPVNLGIAWSWAFAVAYLLVSDDRDYDILRFGAVFGKEYDYMVGESVGCVIDRIFVRICKCFHGDLNGTSLRSN